MKKIPAQDSFTMKNLNCTVSYNGFIHYLRLKWTGTYRYAVPAPLRLSLQSIGTPQDLLVLNSKGSPNIMCFP